MGTQVAPASLQMVKPVTHGGWRALEVVVACDHEFATSGTSPSSRVVVVSVPASEASALVPLPEPVASMPESFGAVASPGCRCCLTRSSSLPSRRSWSTCLRSTPPGRRPKRRHCPARSRRGARSSPADAAPATSASPKSLRADHTIGRPLSESPDPTAIQRSTVPRSTRRFARDFRGKTLQNDTFLTATLSMARDKLR